MSVEIIHAGMVQRQAMQEIFIETFHPTTHVHSSRLILIQVGAAKSPVKRLEVAALQAVIAMVTAEMAEEARIQKP